MYSTFLCLFVRRLFSTQIKKWCKLLPLSVYQKEFVNRLQSHLRTRTPEVWHPFFGKKCVTLKPVLVSTSKILEVCLHSESMRWSPIYSLKHCMGPKNTPVSKLMPLCQAPTHLRIYKYNTCLHWAMPNFDTFSLNKLTCCKSYQGIWKARYSFVSWYRKALKSMYLMPRR